METKKFCPECGSKLDDGAMFCQTCGCNLKTGEIHSDDAERVSQKASTEMQITQQTNTNVTTDYDDELILKKQNDEREALKNLIPKFYIRSSIFIVALILVEFFVNGDDWFIAFMKYGILVPFCFCWALAMFIVARIKHNMYKKVKNMSFMEYKTEFIKRERRKEEKERVRRPKEVKFAKNYRNY